jgi:hypothetical protein
MSDGNALRLCSQCINKLVARFGKLSLCSSQSELSAGKFLNLFAALLLRPLLKEFPALRDKFSKGLFGFHRPLSEFTNPESNASKTGRDTNRQR